MKIKVEIDESLNEEEIIMKVPALNQRVKLIQDFLSDLSKQQTQMIFYKGHVEYYLNLSQILFFETDGKDVQAHTSADMYKIKYKLYELEEILPGYFMRVSKSTILNMKKIYAMHKSISGPCLVEFENTHKQVYVSRRYYKLLRIRLEEKRLIG